MEKFNIYYHVVPQNNGCVYLCQNKYTGDLYLHNKAADETPDALIFSSDSAANEWIKSNIPGSGFKSEWFATVCDIKDFSDVHIMSSLAELGYNFEVGM